MKSEVAEHFFKTLDEVASFPANSENASFLQRLIAYVEQNLGITIQVVKSDTGTLGVRSMSIYGGRNATILVSDKTADKDHLRFSVAHELAHILLAGMRETTGDTSEMVRQGQLTFARRTKDSEDAAAMLSAILLAYAQAKDGRSLPEIEYSLASVLSGTADIDDADRRLATRLVREHVSRNSK